MKLPLYTDIWNFVVYIISGNFICDGIVYVAGVMIGYWADYFEANLAAVAFIGSIMNGIAFGNGPIVACLIKKFGSRSGRTMFDRLDVNNVCCQFQIKDHDTMINLSLKS